MADHIYETLIDQGGSVVGALAYSVYKKQKVEWTKKYILEHAAEPDGPALTAYRMNCLLPAVLQSYIVMGQLLAQEFLNQGLITRIEDIGNETRQSALALSMQEKIDQKLTEKKSFSGFAKDAVTSLITNILALLIAGSLILGIKGLDSLSAAVNNWAKNESVNK